MLLNFAFDRLKIRKHRQHFNEFMINFHDFRHEKKDNNSIRDFVKKLKKNYYDIRSKKVGNLIKLLRKRNFKKSTLGGCIFFKKGENLCLKSEKL